VRGVPLGVALVAIGLYFVGLGVAPFLDPPEGFHAEVAREMALGRDWVTPRVNGVRYFETPPLLYWLMSASFGAAGVTPFAARFWTALAAVGCAAVTARLGAVLGGPRLGLLAGLMVAANLGMFVYGRIVSAELPFILCLTVAWAGFALAYRVYRRPPPGARGLLCGPWPRDAHQRRPGRDRPVADRRRLLLAHARATGGPMDPLVGGTARRRDRAAMVPRDGGA